VPEGSWRNPAPEADPELEAALDRLRLAFVSAEPGSEVTILLRKDRSGKLDRRPTITRREVLEIPKGGQD
jgi:hypothetical protein